MPWEEEDFSAADALAFSKQCSVFSSVSRHSDPDQLVSAVNFQRQRTEIDDVAATAASAGVITDAIKKIVQDCQFCVTIADPRIEDFPLIAVSEQFEAMTGYKQEEILGRNCRILNRDCFIGDRSGLRQTCETGATFTKVLVNRKKSGDLFLNLLDLRGLVVATDPRSGEDLWFLVGIQADVTHLAQDDLPDDHLPRLQEVAVKIRRGIKEELATLAVAGAMRNEAAQVPSRMVSSRENWWLLPEANYRPSNVAMPRIVTEGSSQAESDNLEPGPLGTSGPSRTSTLCRQTTLWSEASFANFDKKNMDNFMRQHSMAIEGTRPSVNIENIHEAIFEAMAGCTFVASIGDPLQDDCPLIAVSDGFLALSGYSREEIVGKNCRFLGRDCNIPEEDLAGLRESCKTGAPFTKVLLNRRKSGDLFYNLVDLRGLTVARNPSSGTDLWFLVGIQADVSHLQQEDIPEDHVATLHDVALDLRCKLTERLSLMAVAGTLATPAEQASSARQVTLSNLWVPVIKARWRPERGRAEAPETEAGPLPLLRASSEEVRPPPLAEEDTPRAASASNDEEHHSGAAVSIWSLVALATATLLVVALLHRARQR